MRTLCVCIDASESSRIAFSLAVHCKAADDKLLVIHVIEAIAPPSPVITRAGFSPSGSVADANKRLIDGAKKVLRPFQAWVKEHKLSNVESDIVVAKGESAKEAAIQFMKEQNVAMCFVGNCAHSGVRRALLGSFASYVLHHSLCDVMVCKTRLPEQLHLEVPTEAAGVDSPQLAGRGLDSPGGTGGQGLGLGLSGGPRGRSLSGAGAGAGAAAGAGAGAASKQGSPQLPPRSQGKSSPASSRARATSSQEQPQEKSQQKPEKQSSQPEQQQQQPQPQQPRADQDHVADKLHALRLHDRQPAEPQAQEKPQGKADQGGKDAPQQQPQPGQPTKE